MGKRRNGFSELLHGCGPGAEAPASGKVLRLDVVPTPDELRRSRAAARRLLAADTVDHDSSRSACRPSRAGSQAGVADLQSPVSWRGHLDAVSPHATSRRACLAAHVRGIFLAGDEFSSRAVLHFSAVSAHSDVLPAATEKPRGEWGSSRGCACLEVIRRTVSSLLCRRAQMESSLRNDCRDLLRWRRGHRRVRLARHSLLSRAYPGAL